MSANRKLQSEIQQVLKKVEEGVEIFDDIWSKVYAAGQQSLKEKYEGDLKKEIKKLQRLRDQIKTWLGSSDVKDKSPLTEARKIIETKMEQFKVCEKDTKTKAYSKEGLARASVLDPREAEKEDKRCWINECLEKLNEVIESIEADMEKAAAKKKNKEQVEKLENRIQKNKWHISRLEQILKLIENDDLEPTKIDSIKEDVEYYIESAKEDDGALGVDDEFDIYEELQLESIIASGEADAAAAAAAESATGANSENVSSVPGTEVDNSKATSITQITPVAVTPIPTLTTPSVASTTASSSTAKVIPPTAKPPISTTQAALASIGKGQPAARGAVPTPAATTTTTTTTSNAAATAAAAKLVAGSAAKVVSVTTTTTTITGSKTTQPISAAAAVTGGGVTKPGTTTLITPSKIDPKKLPPSSSPKTTIAGGEASPADSLPAAPVTKTEGATTWAIAAGQRTAASVVATPPPQLQQPNKVTSAVDAPVGSSALASGSTVLPPSSQAQGSALLSSPSLQPIAAPGQSPRQGVVGSLPPSIPSGVAPGGAATSSSGGPIRPTGAAAVSSSGSPMNGPALIGGLPQQNTVAPLPGAASAASAAAASTSSSTQPSVARASLNPEVVAAVHMLKQSMVNAPEMFEAEKVSGYTPRNPYQTHQAFPQQPPAILENSSLFEKLPYDSLFLSFYYQQGTYQQHLAAKQLKKHSWRFHKKYMTWFQRHEEPKISTEEFEEGTYVYFDYESGWCQRIKSEFKFEYAFLEDLVENR